MAVRSAAQKAAQLKAAKASAAKRRGKGKGRKKGPGRVKRAGSEVKRRYQAGHKGPGANYRRQKDRFNSQGYYKNRTGNKNSKKAGKVQRGYRKASTVASNLNYGVAATTAVSYARHKNAVKKGTVNKPRKKKTKKR